MGIETLSIQIDLARLDSQDVAFRSLLHTVCRSLVRPKSIELNIPGAGVRPLKMDGSLDGPSSYAWTRMARTLLPGEVVVPGCDLTTLKDPDRWLTLPRDEAILLEKVEEGRGIACDARESGHSGISCVAWYAWGLTRAAYLSRSGDVNEGWFLRQHFARCGDYDPLIRIGTYLEPGPCDDFYFSMDTDSFIYSHHDPVYDPEAEGWVPCADRRARRRSAAILVESLAEFAGTLGDADLMWGIDGSRHEPNLAGDLIEMMETAFGPRGKFAPIRNLPIAARGSL